MGGAALCVFLALPSLGSNRDSDQEEKEYGRQRALLQEKFKRLEGKYDLLIQDYNQAKIESRDTIQQWKAYTAKWERSFGKPQDYGVSDRLGYPNLRLANDRLKEIARDLNRLVGLFGNHIEGERDPRTIELETRLEKQIDGLRGLLDITRPVVKEGKWAEAGDVRWRVVSARRKTRDRERGVRLATVRFKLQITGEIMKRLEVDAFTLLTESGEKLSPILRFDAPFAYPEEEKPPFGSFLEAADTHTFMVIFEIPEEDRNFILRVTDLETRSKNDAYISLKM